LQLFLSDFVGNVNFVRFLVGYGRCFRVSCIEAELLALDLFVQMFLVVVSTLYQASKNNSQVVSIFIISGRISVVEGISEGFVRYLVFDNENGYHSLV
jgi:hypothetical protein